LTKLAEISDLFRKASEETFPHIKAKGSVRNNGNHNRNGLTIVTHIINIGKRKV
jgi:hypothetical protein